MAGILFYEVFLLTGIVPKGRIPVYKKAFFYRIGKFVLFDKNPPGGAHDALKEVVTAVTARQR